MKSVGIFEAKTHFSALVEDAIAGKATIITRHGQPVAELRPVEPNRRSRGELALKRLEAMRSRLKGAAISSRELIDEGRR
jgi:prevent-host-death family protein